MTNLPAIQQKSPTTSVNHEVQLVKYLTAIYAPEFSTDDSTTICTSSDLMFLRPLFPRIFSVPASCAPVERIVA